MPKSENDLWDALTALDGGAQASLFAHCASFAVNAVYEPANRYNQGRVSAHGVRTRLDQANVLARAVGLDMVQAGWRYRPSTTISAGSPSRAFSRPCGKPGASRRHN